ncbi:putative acetolactate synthase small subunit [Desulfamplus magnetovallimortis]|uniref:Acetolactate synthase small subunit n=1 Tax=Desulfamplus magnetovallimortis TaxID=1246637 RepID=A0A1W1HFX3_9BACT|nr:acetolactate synthase small subunit [Desulfamplus magnetovallimortis]SLM31336.1 putative acetolactate synthase small subunit [Desulfamplus magnetovallimortis]
MNEKKYVITMLVENEPGVTARITGLFAGRGYNIETICGAPTADPELSRITITTVAAPAQFDQCMKQIQRLTNVIKLRDMTGEEAVKREMALICVNAEPEQRNLILERVEPYRGKIIDIGSKTLTMEVTGKENEIDELLVQLLPFGIVKLARSGVLALYREN